MRILFIIFVLFGVPSPCAAYDQEASSGLVPLRSLILRTYPHVHAEDKKALHGFARTCLSDGDKPYVQSILNFGSHYLARTPHTDIEKPIALMTQLTGLNTCHIQTITSQFFNGFHGHVPPDTEGDIITSLSCQISEEIPHDAPQDLPSDNGSWSSYQPNISDFVSEEEDEESEDEGYEMRSISSEELASIRHMTGYRYPDGHIADGVPCSDDEDYDEYS